MKNTIAMIFFKSKYLIPLSICCIFNSCISTKTSDLARVKGIEHTQEQRITKQGQSLTDILSLFIASQAGVSPSVLLGITNASSINFIERKFDKIERYKEDEYRLNQELLALGKELENLKIEYQVLQRALRELENIKESKRRELKALNRKYAEKVEVYQGKLNVIEEYVRGSKKIVKPELLLNQIKEQRNELNQL